MTDPPKGSDRHLDMVTMGCRWRLDASDLDETEAARTIARWQRPARLAATGTTVLDEELVTVAVHPHRSAYDLSRELTRAGLLRLRGRATLLHAAALADARGRAVVLVAPSGGGKSTAARELGRSLGYISDETVVLLGDGRIAPHPKPPSLITDQRTPMLKEEPSPDELGLGPTPPTPRIAALLTLERDSAATGPGIETVGLLDQVLTILQQTSSTWWLPDGLDRLARAVTAGGAPSRLRYAEIAECVDLVTDHLAAAVPGEQTWTHLPPGPAQRPDEDGIVTGITDAQEVLAAPRLRVVRGPWSDAIAVDGEVLVLAGDRPLRLGGPGAVLWRAVDRPRSIDELTEEVVTALGDHPQAPELVRVAVADLLDHGLLQPTQMVSVRA